MKTEGTHLLLLTISAFWDSSRWAPEGREVSHQVVVIDRFHCISLRICEVTLQTMDEKDRTKPQQKTTKRDISA